MKSKIILILPAFNAAKTLRPFLASLPTQLFDEIMLSDDSSPDTTYQLAKKYTGITVYQTPRNLGYGGNLKFLFQKALDAGGEVIIELHPDGEYTSDGIEPALNAVREGAQLVLGNRFSKGSHALRTGMYLWKYPFNRLLNWLTSRVVGQQNPDWHQGFRVYTRSLLLSLPYQGNSNSYLFSLEIILQSLAKNLKISSVPVTTSYTGKKRGASLRNSVMYVLQSLVLLLRYRSHSSEFTARNSGKTCPICGSSAFAGCRYPGKFSLQYCTFCAIGFTTPMPKQLAGYYSQNYWSEKTFLGKSKALLYAFFQKRRVRFVSEFLPDGTILDVGAGEGIFADQASPRYTVTSLDAPFANVQNASVMKKDFLQWKTMKCFDALVFWESFEHVGDPLAFLRKSHKLLTKQGLLFIEYPRFMSVESRLFGRDWVHIDMPRHLMHFTEAGLVQLLKQEGFTVLKAKGVNAWEYSVAGLVFSIMNRLGFPVFEKDSRQVHVLRVVLLFPVVLFSIVGEVFLSLSGNAPIGLIVARKTT